MKIAIMTWFRDMNYGTILQALALQNYLKKNNYEPTLINYSSPRIRTISDKLTFFQRIDRKKEYLINNHFVKKYKKELAKKKESFFSTINDNCAISKAIVNDFDFNSIGKCYDAYICGSDQIWNPYWFDSRMFLDFVKGKKKISYASSIGVESIPKSLYERYDTYLKDFNYLSVREESGKKELIKINKKYKKTKVVCDPVFLLNKDEWFNLLNINDSIIKDKYIFFYLLSYNKNHWSAIKKLAKEKGLKIVGIPVVGSQFYKYKSAQLIIDASPTEFLNLIKNAECIFTDSFHGTSFSILFNKNFYYFERFYERKGYSTNSRVKNILKTTNLEDRIIEHNSKIINNYSTIDYKDVNNKLNKFICTSKKFLIDSLSD